MKKYALILVSLLVVSTMADAQFFKNILNSAKTQAEKSVEKEVDKKVDQAVTKVFNPKTGKYETVPATTTTATTTQQTESGWICLKCGKMGNTGKFCSDCGAQRPENGNGNWTCPACGHKDNTGNFCGDCGTKRPSATDAENAAAAATDAMNQAAANLNAAASAAAASAAASAATAQTEASNSFAEQMAAFQALGTLTPEELEHLLRLGQQLEKLTEEQAEQYMMSHPDELAFVLNLQLKLANAQLGGAANTNTK